MNSPTFQVCEGLKVFGFSGFREKTEAFRFRQDKIANFRDRDRVHWIEHGKHLPRPDRRTAKRGINTINLKPRQQLKVSNNALEALLAL